MGISWEERVPTSGVLRQAELPGIEALTILRWTGHVLRMDDDRLPKQISSELATGTRTQGGRLKRYTDSLKSSLKTCSIPTIGWETAAADRDRWRLVGSTILRGETPHRTG